MIPIVNITNKEYNKLIFTMIDGSECIWIKQNDNGVGIYNIEDNLVINICNKVEFKYLNLQIEKKYHLKELDVKEGIGLLDSNNNLILVFYCENLIMTNKDIIKLIKIKMNTEKQMKLIKETKLSKDEEVMFVVNKLEIIISSIEDILNSLMDID